MVYVRLNTEVVERAAGDRRRASIARKLGVSRQLLHNWLTGSSRCPLSMAARLARELGIELEGACHDPVTIRRPY